MPFSRDKGLSPRGRGNPGRASSCRQCAGSIPAWAGEPRRTRRGKRSAGVYPRVGGGTRGRALSAIDAQGLSPRGRGNPDAGGAAARSGRSIPARAGEPRARDGSPGGTEVYPRVGGGTPTSTPEVRSVSGLSPRGRGNRDRGRVQRETAGSIPAWAGEPRSLPRWIPRVWVYPRVGGGTQVERRIVRVRGGLSPRGRGNLPRHQCGRPGGGSIPAWAGEPQRGLSVPYPAGVYPRVGGGTVRAQMMQESSGGLSPRGRGNPSSPRPGAGRARSIPAWAGEPGWPEGWSSGSRVYPRVGGGTYSWPLGAGARGGSIPAWAGEPRRTGIGRRIGGVYPRVGGGTAGTPGSPWKASGLSPRGRGNRPPRGPRVARRGSIPAWAGEPRWSMR